MKYEGELIKFVNESVIISNKLGRNIKTLEQEINN